MYMYIRTYVHITYICICVCVHMHVTYACIYIYTQRNTVDVCISMCIYLHVYLQFPIHRYSLHIDIPPSTRPYRDFHLGPCAHRLGRGGRFFFGGVVFLGGNPCDVIGIHGILFLFG